MRPPSSSAGCTLCSHGRSAPTTGYSAFGSPGKGNRQLVLGQKVSDEPVAQMLVGVKSLLVLRIATEGHLLPLRARPLAAAPLLLAERPEGLPGLAPGLRQLDGRPPVEEEDVVAARRRRRGGTLPTHAALPVLVARLASFRALAAAAAAAAAAGGGSPARGRRREGSRDQLGEVAPGGAQARELNRVVLDDGDILAIDETESDIRALR
mmetsp:Transcript_78650/g.204265  ORF Transcript_78650/g.204265 Transcript_78650/m.204265 type:complete len:209 (-) Transcript_78650:266-892(-)